MISQIYLSNLFSMLAAIKMIITPGSADFKILGENKDKNPLAVLWLNEEGP